MTYRIFFTDHGDVFGEYDSEPEAREALADYVSAHPHMVDEVAMRLVDEQGHAAGPVQGAGDVVGQQLHIG